jgi:hypothetical protein
MSTAAVELGSGEKIPVDFRRSISMPPINRRVVRCCCCTIRQSLSRYCQDSFALERIPILGR